MAGTNIYGELIRAQLQNSASDLTGGVTGLIYWNTGTSFPKWYTGAAWKTAVDENSTQTITGKTLTGNIIVSFVSGAATITAPTTTSTLATLGLAETFTGVKTLTSALLAGGSLDITAAGNFSFLASVGANTITIGGATSTVTIAGLLSSTTVDTSFTFQDNADSTKKFQFDAANIPTGTTKTFGVPNANTTFLGTDTVQVITNKDHDGGTASNTNRFTIPKDTLTNLTALTRKQATVVFDTTSNKPYYDDGSLLKAFGSGSGGSGRNYLSDNSDGSTVGTVGSGNVTDTGNRSTGTVAAWQTTNSANISITSSSSTPLREGTSYLTTGSGNAAAGTTFLESPAFNIDTVDLGKAVGISFDVSGGTTATDWDVCVVRYNSSGTFQEKISVAGTASTGTPASALINTGTTTFNGFFVTSNTQTDYYAVRFRRLAGTVNLRLDSLFVGPSTYMSGYAGTDWVSYTGFLSAVTTPPTLGTGGTSLGTWRRVGDSMELHWGFNQTAAGSAGTGVYLLLLPTGYTIDLLKTPDNHSVFDDEIGTGYMSIGGVEYKAVVYVHSSTQLRVDLFTAATATGSWSAAAQSFGANANYRVALNAKVAISQWTSNVQLANRAVEEYAYNTSTTDANDTTSFGYGAAGGQFGSFTTERSKRVRFTTPILPTDKIFLEASSDSGVTWFDGYSWAGNTTAYETQNTATYGWYLDKVNATDVFVGFAHYTIPTGATFGAAGGAWSTLTASNFRWRVRKVSGGAAVGYPIQSSNIVGRLDAALPGSGFVGQTLSKVIAQGSAITGSGSATYNDITSLTLPVGTFMVWGSASVSRNGGTYTLLTFQPAITTTSGNSATGYANGINAPDFEIGNSALTFNTISLAIAPLIMKNDGTTISYQTDTGSFTAFAAGQTLYLKGYVDTYTGANAKFHGFITAMRIA